MIKADDLTIESGVASVGARTLAQPQAATCPRGGAAASEACFSEQLLEGTVQRPVAEYMALGTAHAP